MDTFFYILLTALIIDGIKLLVESYSKFIPQQYKFSNNRVTAIIAARNEEQVIVDTVRSVANAVGESNIIVVDDASTDNTALVLLEADFKGSVIRIKHAGKVGAIREALKAVRTPYTLLLDADIRLSPNFVLPTSLLDADEATAVTFNIVPQRNWRTWRERFWTILQSYEYSKSMQIGKRYHDITKSVHCISGAAGLFRTDRLRELSAQHTGIFPGEDLERTLLELLAKGRVAFCQQEIETDVPRTFLQLSRQRVVGWWPGLWRNIRKFMLLVIKPRVALRLRLELAYELFSLATDPFKLWSLCALVVAQQWTTLYVVYVVYLLLEIVVYWRISIIQNRYLHPHTLAVIAFYPVYSLLNLVYRMAALGVYAYKMMFTSWRRATFGALTALPLCVFGTPAVRAADSLWVASVSYSRVSDVNKLRALDHYTLDVGYRAVYVAGVYGAWQSVSAGVYHPYGVLDVRVRANDLAVTARGEYWVGNWVPTMSLTYVRLFKAGQYPEQEYPTLGLGVVYYTSDASVGLSAIKEYGRARGLTAIARLKYEAGRSWLAVNASCTSFGDPAAGIRLGYRTLFIGAEYYTRYDFESFDRLFVTVGLQWQW